MRFDFELDPLPHRPAEPAGPLPAGKGSPARAPSRDSNPGQAPAGPLPRRMTGPDRLAFHASAPLIDAVHRAALRRGIPTAAFLRDTVAAAIGHEDPSEADT